MPKNKAQQALDFYKDAARVCPTPRDLHNVFFGIGGKFGQLFPTREEREAFMRSPEFAEIDRIRDAIDGDSEQEETTARPPKRRPATKR
jgi:hypothetical protein